ncbi:MAG: PhnD/SsuA/transferrin family substrate-binding protein [Thiolinea sp.]
MRARLWLVLVLIAAFGSPVTQAADDPLPPVQIGVLAYEGKQRSQQRWQATIDYLGQAIPAYRFQLQPLTHEEMLHAVTKNQLDFILTNPGYYVQLEARHGATRIATFKSRYQQQSLNRFGAVIFTRRDSPIKELAELRGHSLAAVNLNAFGGFLLARQTLAEAGVRDDDLRYQWLGFPQRDIVTRVLSGKVSAGTVRTGILEQLAAKGELDLQELRILAPRQTTGFPLLHSTQLYPEWPFAQLPHAPPALAKAVAIALLQMPENSPAALAAEGSGWTIPLDYTTVHELLRALHVSPYDQVAGAEASWLRYRSWFLSGGLLLLASLAISALILRTNRRLQWSQRTLLQEKAERQNIENLLANQRQEIEDIVARRTQQLQQNNQELQLEIEGLMRFEKYFHQHVQANDEINTATPTAQTDPKSKEIAALRERFAAVTPREREVLERVAQGEPNKNIAKQLNISPKTVELHRANLISKTGARASTDLVRLAVLAGVIE